MRHTVTPRRDSTTIRPIDPRTPPRPGDPPARSTDAGRTTPTRRGPCRRRCVVLPSPERTSRGSSASARWCPQLRRWPGCPPTGDAGASSSYARAPGASFLSLGSRRSSRMVLQTLSTNFFAAPIASSYCSERSRRPDSRYRSLIRPDMGNPHPVSNSHIMSHEALGRTSPKQGTKVIGPSH